MNTIKHIKVLLLFVFILPILSGCGLFNVSPESSVMDRVTIASANQIFTPEFEGFSDEQLLLLLDPNYGLKNTENENENEIEFSNLNSFKKNRQLRRAFKAANDNYKAAHRSQIQDRLIAASNQRCNLYTTYLKRVSTNQNAFFGSLTTILGGAGAIVTGADSARILSGLAGISSGTRSELNQAIFESAATSVIVPGIHSKRAELLTEMSEKRHLPLDNYTVEGAIADAIVYHGACSLDEGVSFAQKSIISYEDIGIKKFTAIQEQLGKSRNISEAFILGPLDSLFVSEIILKDICKKLDELKDVVDSLKKETLILKHTLLTKSCNEGDYKVEAEKLDESLSKIVLLYSSSTGEEKSNQFKLLKAQQVNARDFQHKVHSEYADLSLEIKNR
ncbi:hypothetical protein [Psychromonas sp. SR45-3]|uniref:hypothetical protein n=1 Tax=Psychromonas sp. SR45-3 TaxID=2760930 RepID=UPI0015F7F33D|nr:hypothetical protein [Psychromonas sp. SR45-3]MBB1274816.1 hypothetical protein [Psychromonas sp. SR45-3]